MESNFEKTAEVLRKSVETAEDAIRWLQLQRWDAKSRNLELQSELLRRSQAIRPPLEPLQPSMLPMAVAEAVEHPTEGASTDEVCIETPMTVATPLELEGAGVSEMESGVLDESEKTPKTLGEGEIAPQKRIGEEITENRKNVRVDSGKLGIMSMNLVKLRCRYALRKWFPTQVKQWALRFKSLGDEGKSPQDIFMDFCNE